MKTDEFKKLFENLFTHDPRYSTEIPETNLPDIIEERESFESIMEDKKSFDSNIGVENFRSDNETTSLNSNQSEKIEDNNLDIEDSTLKNETTQSDELIIDKKGKGLVRKLSSIFKI
jgi:hypothetical protein